MGLFDSIKNTFGKGAPAADTTKAPSQWLREAGLDPSGLKFSFGNASITVAGTIAGESDRENILAVLSGIPGINSVADQLVVASAADSGMASGADEDLAESAAPVTPADDTPADEGSPRTYTVVSGDTLWKIAERMYGNGSDYMKIFEANTAVLEHPDRIFPGQKLVIPEP
jgi:nucleoid-associated protein YgaU